MTRGAASGGTFAVITGGGTSGHVLPALAIADALVAAGHARDSIHYVGGQHGVETTLLPPTGYPSTFLDVVGLQRSFSKRNLAFLPKLLRSLRAAKTIDRRVASGGGRQRRWLRKLSGDVRSAEQQTFRMSSCRGTVAQVWSRD